MAETKSSRADYKREWYKKNKEKERQKRKERYQNDPKYREAAKAKSKRSYWMGKNDGKPDSEQAKAFILEHLPSQPLDIEVTDPEDIRYGDTVTVRGYTMGAVAKVFYDKSVHTLRLWEARGVLPEANHRTPQNHRIYTEDQMRAFLDFRYLTRIEQVMRDEDALFRRLLKERWDSLPNGLRPIPRALRPGVCTNPVCGYRDMVDVPVDNNIPVKPTLCPKCRGRMKVDA